MYFPEVLRPTSFQNVVRKSSSQKYIWNPLENGILRSTFSSYIPKSRKKKYFGKVHFAPDLRMYSIKVVYRGTFEKVIPKSTLNMYFQHAVVSQAQMDRADHRMTQLRDLLHNAGVSPMTEAGNYGVVMQERVLPTHPKLVAKVKPLLVRGNYRQLPKWIGKNTKKLIMAHLRSPIYMTHAKPHTIGSQLTLTLPNRLLDPTHPKYLVKMTFRAVPKLYGKPIFDNVKVVLSKDDDGERMYIGRYSMQTKTSLLSAT